VPVPVVPVREVVPVVPLPPEPVPETEPGTEPSCGSAPGLSGSGPLMVPFVDVVELSHCRVGWRGQWATLKKGTSGVTAGLTCPLRSLSMH
jgi:hypothetical protein